MKPNLMLNRITTSTLARRNPYETFEEFRQ